MQIGSVVWEEFLHIHTYIHTYTHIHTHGIGLSIRVTLNTKPASQVLIIIIIHTFLYCHKVVTSEAMAEQVRSC